MELLKDRNECEYIGIKKEIGNKRDYLLVDLSNGKMMAAYNANIKFDEIKKIKYVEWEECRVLGISKENELTYEEKERGYYLRKILEIRKEYLKNALENSIVLKENLEIFSIEEIKEIIFNRKLLTPEDKINALINKIYNPVVRQR